MAGPRVSSTTGNSAKPVDTEMVNIMEQDNSGLHGTDKLMAILKKKAGSARKGVRNLVRRAINLPQVLAAQVCQKNLQFGMRTYNSAA